MNQAENGIKLNYTVAGRLPNGNSDRNNLSHVIPARSSPRRIAASESQSRPAEDCTVTVMGDGNQGLSSIMDTEDRNYLEQMEAHLRLLNADIELNVFDMDSHLISENTGETGQMPCDSNSHWKMVNGEAGSDSRNSDVELLEQESHGFPLDKLAESQQEGCQMAVAPSLSLRRELARARQLKSRLRALSQADKQPRGRQAAGTSDMREPPYMKTPIEVYAGQPSQDNSAIHLLKPIDKQPRRSPRLAAGTHEASVKSFSAKDRKPSAGQTPQNQMAPLLGKQPRRRARIAVQEVSVKINERETVASDSLQDETHALSLVPVDKHLAAETDDVLEASLKPSGMRVTPIQEREPSQDLSVEPLGLHVDLTADNLEPLMKFPEAGVAVPLNGKELESEPLETEVSGNSTETKALKTKRKRVVLIDEAQMQPAFKGKRKYIHVEGSAAPKVETRSASKTRVETHQLKYSVEMKVETLQENSAEPKVRKRNRDVPINKALKSNPESKVLQVIPGSRIKRNRGVPIHELDGTSSIGAEDVPVAACKPASTAGEPVLNSVRRNLCNGGFSLEVECNTTAAKEPGEMPVVERIQTRRSSRLSAASSEGLGLHEVPPSINKKQNRVHVDNLNADSVVVKASTSKDAATPKSGPVKKLSFFDEKNGQVGLPRRSPRFVTV